MPRPHLSVALALAALSLACSHGKSAGGAAQPREAVAKLNPTAGSSVTGTVTFTPAAGGVLVRADVSGLSPGKHGFHVHEKGDCSAPDGTSAGGHFNPGHHEHGAPTAEMRHTGDLGNLVADESGHATLEWTDPMLALEGENSVVGRGVIVHANEDDLKTQPTGNAGARLACGVIEAAK